MGQYGASLLATVFLCARAANAPLRPPEWDGVYSRKLVSRAVGADHHRGQPDFLEGRGPEGAPSAVSPRPSRASPPAGGVLTTVKKKLRSPARSARAGKDADAVPPDAALERLRMALDAAGMVTWDWDVGAHTIRYSDNVPALARGTDVKPYCTTDGLIALVHPDDRDRIRAAIHRAVTMQEPYDCEYRVRMLDGRYHWIHGKGKRVIVRGGALVRVLGVSQDITARKQAEQELERRTRQLAELASALSMAEHRERRRLADLIHDGMQQLLVGARMQVQKLLAGERGTWRNQLDGLDKTLGETLDLARSMMSNLAPPVLLHRDPVSAFVWLASIMRTRHGLSVALRTDRRLPRMPEPLLLFVFTSARELLINVAKHAGARRAALSLRRSSGNLLLEVRDRGKGFDPAALPPPGGDGGFGLFSIRERAELLGGTLSVGSVPKRGTRVLLSLPLTREAPAAAQGGAAERAPGGERRAAGRRPRRPRRGSPVRIVLADDHLTVREGLRQMIEMEDGYRIVAEADNGREAIMCVERHSPDIVIMDARLPVMDGIEATRIIAKRWPRVKVLGLSMHDSDSPIGEGFRAAGAVAYVPKAAPPKEFLRALRSCLPGRPRR